MCTTISKVIWHYVSSNRSCGANRLFSVVVTILDFSIGVKQWFRSLSYYVLLLAYLVYLLFLPWQLKRSKWKTRFCTLTYVTWKPKDVLSTGTSQWSNESGLWSLGGYIYEECTTTLSCFHVLLSHSPNLPKDFCSAYSRLNFNLEQHSKRGWIQNNSRFTDKELWFLPPKLVSKEVPCCKWHYKERQG